MVNIHPGVDVLSSYYSLISARSTSLGIITYKLKGNPPSLGATNRDIEEDPRALYNHVSHHIKPK